LLVRRVELGEEGNGKGTNLGEKSETNLKVSNWPQKFERAGGSEPRKGFTRKRETKFLNSGGEKREVRVRWAETEKQKVGKNFGQEVWWEKGRENSFRVITLDIETKSSLPKESETARKAVVHWRKGGHRRGKDIQEEVRCREKNCAS